MDLRHRLGKYWGGLVLKRECLSLRAWDRLYIYIRMYMYVCLTAWVPVVTCVINICCLCLRYFIPCRCEKQAGKSLLFVFDAIPIILEGCVTALSTSLLLENRWNQCNWLGFACTHAHTNWICPTKNRRRIWHICVHEQCAADQYSFFSSKLVLYITAILIIIVCMISVEQTSTRFSVVNWYFTLQPFS